MHQGLGSFWRVPKVSIGLRLVSGLFVEFEGFGGLWSGKPEASG